MEISLGLALGNSSRGGVVYSPEAQALFARFTNPPTAAREALIDALIVSLKTAGIWSKLDFLHLMAAADEQAGQRNWKADQFNLTPQSAPVFTADQGYAGDGIDDYLDTGFNPTIAAGQYTLNSASVGIYCRTAAALSNANMADLGVPTGGLVRVAARNTGDVTTVRINRASSATTPNTDGVGLFHVSRINAAGYKAFKNGVETLDVPSAPSVALPNDNITLLRDAGFYSTHQLAASFAGAGLSGAENASISSAITAYLQGIGAA